MPKLPSLSIAAKLYTIFALLATRDLGAGRRRARQLAAPDRDDARVLDVASPARRTSSASTVSIYAVVMELRGIYMSFNSGEARLRSS